MSGSALNPDAIGKAPLQITEQVCVGRGLNLLLIGQRFRLFVSNIKRSILEFEKK